MATVGQNVSMAVENDELVIRVNLKQSFGPSKSGKTISIASTLGNVGVPGNDGTKIGLNVYRYPTDAEKKQHGLS